MGNDKKQHLPTCQAREQRRLGDSYYAPAVFAGPDHPWIDSSSAPVFQWNIPPQASDDEVIACVMAREDWARTASFPCAWVVDLTHLRHVPATQRKLFAEHLKRFEPHDVAHNRGSALIIPNSFVRGIVTAIFWLSPPMFPNKAFDTRPDAMAWARKRLADPDS